MPMCSPAARATMEPLSTPLVLIYVRRLPPRLLPGHPRTAIPALSLLAAHPLPSSPPSGRGLAVAQQGQAGVSACGSLCRRRVGVCAAVWWRGGAWLARAGGSACSSLCCESSSMQGVLGAGWYWWCRTRAMAYLTDCSAGALTGLVRQACAAGSGKGALHCPSKLTLDLRGFLLYTCYDTCDASLSVRRACVEDWAVVVGHVDAAW